MKLKLNCSDVLLQMEIKGPAKDPEWLNVDFSLDGRYIHYLLTDDELIPADEVRTLARELEALLNREMMEDCTVELTEPDLRFALYPAKRLFSVPGKILYVNGYMDRDPYAELIVAFWLDEGGLGGNQLTLKLKEPELWALMTYLKLYLGEISGEDGDVKQLLQAGVLAEE